MYLSRGVDLRHDLTHNRYPWLAFAVRKRGSPKYEPVLVLNWRPGALVQPIVSRFRFSGGFELGEVQDADTVQRCAHGLPPVPGSYREPLRP
jgi:hypothetical protein